MKKCEKKEDRGSVVEELIKSKGWTMNMKEDLLDDFIETSPQNVDLSKKDIIEEVRAVRYRK